MYELVYMTEKARAAFHNGFGIDTHESVSRIYQT